MGFKDEVKHINSKFYVKEFDGPKEEKTHSSGLLYYGETHHIQVWDIDNRGEHYMVMEIKDRTPGRGDLAWLKQADHMRKIGATVKSFKKHHEKSLDNEAADARRKHSQSAEMAKDFRKALIHDNII